MKSKKRPTLKDVAQETGISITQTSRALNGRHDVSAQTRRLVLEAATRIGYAPNLEARRLKMPETRANSIGLVLATKSQRFSDPFFGDLLTGLVDEAAQYGFELQLSAPLVDEDPTISYMRAVATKRVDAFVVLRAARHDPRVTYLREQEVPFVTLGRIDDLGGHPAVNFADDALDPAIEHLVMLGHKRIGCLAEPLEYVVAAHRVESFHQALAAHGLEADPAHIVPSGFREDEATEATKLLLHSADPPTALVAVNDLLAMGALRAAAEYGLVVPDDLSVIGFDDIVAARFLSPALTTMRYPAQDVGAKLIEQLLTAIEDPTYEGDFLVKPELVVRQSTTIVKQR
ncbi:MAG: LacI family transcriptional regulator [Acidimicrobiia bacterium]|nr:LacI family transcriptional regulator [Acidimicrobiia bacterium]